MPTSELAITETHLAERAEITGIGSLCENVLATEIDAREQIAPRWQEIIDHKLIEWGHTQSEFEAEGLVGPNYKALSTAFKIVKYMREQSWPLPTGVIPDGEGGVVFENRHDPLYQRIEIDQNGCAFLATFHNCQLRYRVPVDIE